MKNLFKSWKTSLVGSGALVAGITQIVNDPANWKAALPAILTGLIGLLAKDGNVTHSK